MALLQLLFQSLMGKVSALQAARLYFFPDLRQLSGL